MAREDLLFRSGLQRYPTRHTKTRKVREQRLNAKAEKKKKEENQKSRSEPLALFRPQIDRSVEFLHSAGGVGLKIHRGLISYCGKCWLSGSGPRKSQQGGMVAAMGWKHKKREEEEGEKKMIGLSLTEARRPRAKGGSPSRRLNC